MIIELGEEFYTTPIRTNVAMNLSLEIIAANNELIPASGCPHTPPVKKSKDYCRGARRSIKNIIKRVEAKAGGKLSNEAADEMILMAQSILAEFEDRDVSP